MPSPFNSKVENLPRHAYFGLITFGAELMNQRRRRKGLLRLSPIPFMPPARSNQIRVASGEDGKNRGDQAMLPRQRTVERESE